jgi:hypothetical protein
MGMSQKDYEEKFPTFLPPAATGPTPAAPGPAPTAPGPAPAADKPAPAADKPAPFFYSIKPGDRSQQIYALAERGVPGVKKLWATRNEAFNGMKAMEKRLSEAGLPEGERSRFKDLYEIEKERFTNSNTAWKDTLDKVTEPARQALTGSNAVRTQNNLDFITSLNSAADLANQAKQTIAQMKDDIQEGGPATTVLTKFSSGLKQAGVDPNLIGNIINQPDAVQKQRLLADQLKLQGMDEGQIQALRAGAGPEFEKKAVLALLQNIEKRADAQIAAFEAANARFQDDPVNADVAGTSFKEQKRSNAKTKAKPYRSHPVKGALTAGTPYKVFGDSTVYYAK